MHIEQWGKQGVDTDALRVVGNVDHFIENQERVSEELQVPEGPVTLRPELIGELDAHLSLLGFSPGDLQYVKDPSALQAAFAELNAISGGNDWKARKPILSRIGRMVDEGLG